MVSDTGAGRTERSGLAAVVGAQSWRGAGKGNRQPANEIKRLSAESGDLRPQRAEARFVIGPRISGWLLRLASNRSARHLRWLDESDDLAASIVRLQGLMDTKRGRWLRLDLRQF
jgi:hypothetical protein